MENKKPMTLASRKNSFAYAINGLKTLLKEEPNAKLHAAGTVIAIVAGIVKHISPTQWLAILFAIGLVWITEALNTCIEKLCDFSCNKESHPTIKIIKDISAGAVLVAAMVSVAVAAIIFLF